MIEYKKGDLFDAFRAGEIEAFGHQANCMNTMGSGFAKQLKALYPDAYEADCQTEKGDMDKLGTLSMTIVDVPGHAPGLIFNLYGQYDYGREPGKVYTDIVALGQAMGIMRLFVDASGVEHIGFPRLGCGLGGAKWEDVETLIEFHFGDLNVTVFDKEG